MPYARHGGEGHGALRRAVHRFGEVGEEGLDGAGGVGHLFGEEFEPDDLMGVGGPGGGHLTGPCEVAGQPGVDQVCRDSAPPQQEPPDSSTPSSRRRAR